MEDIYSFISAAINGCIAFSRFKVFKKGVNPGNPELVNYLTIKTLYANSDFTVSGNFKYYIL